MEKLKSVQCPFTWFSEDATPRHTLKFKSFNGEHRLPLMELMRNLMQRYVDSISGSTLEEGEEILCATPDAIECDRYLTALESSDADEQNFSHDVIRHIVHSTYAFIVLKAGMIAELEETLPKIENVNISNEKGKSTLLGCKAICYLICAQANEQDDHHLVEAKKLIREAIDSKPQCHLWYFVLGNILRNQRRAFSYEDTDYEELRSFQKANLMSVCPTYRRYRDKAHEERKVAEEDAFKISEDLCQEPTSGIMPLRLAAIYIFSEKMDKAREYLERVSDSAEAKTSMFLHYKGLYFFRLRQYQEAARFLEDAAKQGCLAADYKYIECKLKIDENFKHEVSGYLLRMVEKYCHFPEKQNQRILLDVAISYWKNDENMEEALKYFLRALNLGPRPRIFKSFESHKIGVKLQGRNIFQVVSREFLPHIYERYDSPEILAMANTLEKYCVDYENAKSG
ncbi:hypothetical protein QAD02_017570 [Eretmocerus hayati]|uniref:Uncharacterized protein n=1 Tax=Eretmocerus hayati TaxID=131215 RepID=A0ACC2PFE2_9HYME|nr:hypothetical protein QAD02_017570 [Eretmocerus hayati]